MQSGLSPVSRVDGSEKAVKPHPRRFGYGPNVKLSTNVPSPLQLLPLARSVSIGIECWVGKKFEIAESRNDLILECITVGSAAFAFLPTCNQ